MKSSVIIKMRNNVVFCANKTVKLNVLHPCVDTLKKKLQAFELQHMVQNISLRNSKKRVLIFFEHNLRQDNFLSLKNKLEIRLNGTVKSSSVYNVINKIETKDLPQFNWPFSIKKPQFNRRIHNASSTSYLPS